MIGELVGSYRVDKKLGEGGMGVVYVAQHPLLHKKAVVKFLHAELSSNQEIVQRFFNEARAATLMKHPGIVDVFDFGYHASGCAFILMEFLEGESLRERLEKGPLTTVDALALGRQIAGACGAAHQRGIVHRDLKPDNIFLVPDVESPGRTRVKVLDFGIAKLASEEAGLKTRTGSVMGTPMYMAPEQCKSAGEVDQRADIYSVGCILFEMLCGQSPFASAGSLAQIIAAHMFETPPAPRALNPTIQPDLEQVILKCLAKDPADRFATMADLVQHLGGGNESQPEMAALALAPRPLAAGIEQPKAALKTTLTGSAAEVIPASPPPRRRTMLLVAGAAGALAIAGVGYIATRGGSQVAASEPTKVPPDAAIAGAPDAQRQVTLRIDSTPPRAGVYRFVDGLRVGETPFEQKLAPTAGTAVYVLKLEGHDDTRVELATDRDNSQTIELHEVATKPAQVAGQHSVTRPKPPMTRPNITSTTTITTPSPTPPPKDVESRSTTGTLRPKFKPTGNNE